MFYLKFKRKLSRGFKYSFKPSRLYYCSFPTPFEKIASNLKKIIINHPRFSFNYVKVILKSLALSSFHRLNSFRPSNISTTEVTVVRNLSKQKDLAIVCPDKGNGVILFNRSDSVSKVDTIFNNASKFVKLGSDPLKLCQRMESRLLHFLRDSLFSSKAIPQNVYHELFTSGSTSSILYGLPKVHESGCLSRPIFSAISTYNYKLATMAAKSAGTHSTISGLFLSFASTSPSIQR